MSSDRSTNVPADVKIPVNKKGIPLYCPHCKMESLEYGGKGFDKHIERCRRHHEELVELDVKHREKLQAQIKEENRDESAAQEMLKKVKAFAECGQSSHDPNPTLKPEFHYLPETPYSLRTTQHGGRHYKRLKIQPAYYCHVNQLRFLESEAIKYLSRFRDKAGAQDLKKVIHFAQMILDVEYNVQSDITFSDEKKEEQNANKSSSSGKPSVEEVSSPQ